ncbi:MAG: RHS repeat-associated core domain-containing protein [Bacteroidota bacterium]
MTIDSTANIKSYDDFYPYGMVMEKRSGNIGQNDTRFKFSSKERDVETGLDYFGARSYDARIVRWLVVDPLREKYFNWSPYIYSLDNPINSIDPNGKWSIKVVVYDDRSATLCLFDKNGNCKGYFEAKAKGESSDRMAQKGDTPFGTYSIEGWIIPNDKQSAKDKKSYGPNPRLILDPKEGEAVEAENKGRWGFRVHGGDLDENEDLRSTWGCIRMSNYDMSTLNSITKEMERADKEERPTELEVVGFELTPRQKKIYEREIVPANF